MRLPRLCGARLAAGLLLVSLWTGGCVPLPVVPASPAPPAAARQGTGEPALRPETAGVLEARRVDVSPRLDGGLDPVWMSAQPLTIALKRDRGAPEEHEVWEVELRAVYTDDTLFLLARWAGAPPTGAADTTLNRLTVHWTIPALAGGPAPACNVACHTAYVDGQGRVAYMHSETVPQGGQDALPAAGGWAANHWSIAWSRPLVSANPYDLQFSDLDAKYRFFVKVFAQAENQPDPISESHVLVFEAHP